MKKQVNKTPPATESTDIEVDEIQSKNKNLIIKMINELTEDPRSKSGEKNTR